MDRDRLIAEIAKETGIRLDRADPLLAAATTNRILLDEALAELQRAVRISGIRSRRLASSRSKRQRPRPPVWSLMPGCGRLNGSEMLRLKQAMP
jgi:hypothetical protein